jgi:tetratricopeptide (TPR) repeat protein
MTDQEKAEGIRFYTKKIKENRNNMFAYVMRSAGYESMGKYDAALVDALQIIDLDSEYWRGHYLALKFYIHLANWEEATKIVQKFENDESFEDLIKKFHQLKPNETLLKKNQKKGRISFCKFCNIL